MNVKDEMNQAVVNAALDDIQYLCSKRDHRTAQNKMEEIVGKLETQGMVCDDETTTYHSFREEFEELLFRQLYKPVKELRQAPLIYSDVYLKYGSILLECKDLENAKRALWKALRWNPISAEIRFEYAEILKAMDNLEEFLRSTLDTFRVAFHAVDVARCYSNLGYYYAEKQKYDAAVACLAMSLLFDSDSLHAKFELEYISLKINSQIDLPTLEEITMIAEQYGFPSGPDDSIVRTALRYGVDRYNQKDYRQSEYFLSIVYELTHQSKIRDILDKIKEK